MIGSTLFFRSGGTDGPAAEVGTLGAVGAGQQTRIPPLVFFCNKMTSHVFLALQP